MDELKSKAAPKYSELTIAVREQNELLDVQIVLLDRLCTLKETQQESDDNFRDSWRNAKIFDTKVSLWVLVLANLALYLDVVTVNTAVPFISWLSEFFGG